MGRAESPGSTPATILIIDDNPADRRLIREALTDSGIPFSLQEITTGDAAVQLAETLGRDPGLRIPDLLILDLNLPCVNGIDVLRAFRANPACAHLQALMLTGSASPADVARIQDIPGARYMSKPEDIEEMDKVAEVIREMLAQRSRDQRLH